MAETKTDLPDEVFAEFQFFKPYIDGVDNLRIYEWTWNPLIKINATARIQADVCNALALGALRKTEVGGKTKVIKEAPYGYSADADSLDPRYGHMTCAWNLLVAWDKNSLSSRYQKGVTIMELVTLAYDEWSRKSKADHPKYAEIGEALKYTFDLLNMQGAPVGTYAATSKVPSGILEQRKVSSAL